MCSKTTTIFNLKEMPFSVPTSSRMLESAPWDKRIWIASARPWAAAMWSAAVPSGLLHRKTKKSQLRFFFWHLPLQDTRVTRPRKESIWHQSRQPQILVCQECVIQVKLFSTSNSDQPLASAEDTVFHHSSLQQGEWPQHLLPGSSSHRPPNCSASSCTCYKTQTKWTNYAWNKRHPSPDGKTQHCIRTTCTPSL